jgi:hypothetical protein
VRPSTLKTALIVKVLEKMFFLFSRLGTPSSITILNMENLLVPYHDSPKIRLSATDFAVGAKVFMRLVDSALLMFEGFTFPALRSYT